MSRRPFIIGVIVVLLTAALQSFAQSFYLPTPNREIFKSGNETRFYAPTPGRDWISGSYGCVRSEGYQFHEGIDILRVDTDRRGEPVDQIRATAGGTVAYVSGSSGNSNYGKYVVLRHYVEGISVYSLYAHLSTVSSAMKPNAVVRPGQSVGTMGRTSNTRSAIGKYRAHLHFEIALVVNDRFSDWYKKEYRGGVNVHGVWNGRNLIGLDPTAILRRQQTDGQRFSLLNLIRGDREMFRVLVPKKDFFFSRYYRPLMRRNAVAEKEGVDGYEIVINYAGIPCQLIPRSKNEVEFGKSYTLLKVDDTLARQRRCRKLLQFKGGKWSLSTSGKRFLDMLTYR